MALPVKRPLAVGAEGDDELEHDETSSLLGTPAGRAAAGAEGSWSRSHWRIIITAYLGYMSKTFGEAAFDLTTPARQKACAGCLNLSDESTANVLSIGSFSYLSGKLLLGSFGDR